MEQIQSVQEMIKLRKSLDGHSVGFVPTMGALHQGHLELLKAARQENEKVVLSIFVNPTQFNNPSDFKNYPITLAEDLRMAQEAAVDFVLTPQYQDLYQDNYRFKMTENEFSKRLCGQYRPGHFEGVLSVVLKLLNIVRPEAAYFGEKDYQQYKLIKDMADTFFISSQIKMVETVRESSGLAMSSRNLRLSPEQKILAPKMYQIISQKISPDKAIEELQKLGFQVDYVEDHDDRRFAAAFLGDVRLIDNVKI